LVSTLFIHPVATTGSYPACDGVGCNLNLLRRDAVLIGMSDEMLYGLAVLG